MVGDLPFGIDAFTERIEFQFVDDLTHRIFDVLHAYILVKLRHRLFGRLTTVFDALDIRLGSHQGVSIATNSKLTDLQGFIFGYMRRHRYTRMITVELLIDSIQFVFGCRLQGQAVVILKHGFRHFDNLLRRIRLEVELIAEERSDSRVVLHELS